jgi:hypothetical protein
MYLSGAVADIRAACSSPGAAKCELGCIIRDPILWPRASAFAEHSVKSVRRQF